MRPHSSHIIWVQITADFGRNVFIFRVKIQPIMGHTYVTGSDETCHLGSGTATMYGTLEDSHFLVGIVTKKGEENESCQNKEYFTL